MVFYAKVYSKRQTNPTVISLFHLIFIIYIQEVSPIKNFRLLSSGGLIMFIILATPVFLNFIFTLAKSCLP